MVMQKVVVAISIVWFLLIAFRVSMATIQVITLSRREVLAKQAEKYAARLKQGHLVRRKPEMR